MRNHDLCHFQWVQRIIFTKLKYIWMYYDIRCTFLISIFENHCLSYFLFYIHRYSILLFLCHNLSAAKKYRIVNDFFLLTIEQWAKRCTVTFIKKDANYQYTFFLYWKMEGFICAMTLHTLMFIKLISSLVNEKTSISYWILG